ncbi:CMP-N-acetylneuraminate-beta-galactosamide-alpha-2,3-sialyltransferase 2-like [Salarias fasciatus]|uniref:CMP-N-acetylneuraminate-beta-galactosamide- alpha-2,3-sialyltransferase 2-like n=1 Tax=Salarias fasciatus TaxID=181472 RepID=UPI0011767562|nr:CMP-N-acetylneuraminate-beta-galactosamide-alpha-2,3-sialyltransferase 2-like [Salarias fasciatus]
MGVAPQLESSQTEAAKKMYRLGRRKKAASTLLTMMRLQPGRGNFKHYNSILDKLFEVIPPTPGVVRPSPRRCRTCAVVGNSGNLIGSHYGSLIDGHDIVIRMNKGPTEGFEADVGNKTTHRVMYPHSAVKLDNSSRLVFFAYKINDLMWLQKQFDPKAKSTDRIANKDLVMILNPAFIRYVHEAWLQKKGHYPSTGFITIALSLQICDEVSIFGFGADKRGSWNHYFEKIKKKRFKTGQHAGNQEHTVIEKLHSKEKIQVFVPQ